MLNGFVIAVCLYAVLYVLFSIVVAHGERRLRSRPLTDDLPNVSVVVCARNEESNIGRCCESLLALDYPRDRLEIILVDDESEDRTRAVMEDYRRREPVIRILSTENEPRVLRAKQRPLNMGIRESKGTFVMLTDADIAVGPGWIRAHLATYGADTGIAGGTTRVDVSSGTLFDRVQCCDLLSKHAAGMGSAGLGLPVSLMGNNVSFRREAYNLVGGISGIDRSIVEDMALMNAVVRRTSYRMTWVAGRAGVVVTAPEKDFGAFVAQRMRWVFEIGDLSLTGKVFVGVESIMAVVCLISVAVAWITPVPLMAAAFAWIAGYAVILLPSPGRERGDLWYIPATLVFQVVYAAVFAFRRMERGNRVVWKGRVFEKGV